jgi:nitrogen fixation-related uncharacterized protein
MTKELFGNLFATAVILVALIWCVCTGGIDDGDRN